MQARSFIFKRVLTEQKYFHENILLDIKIIKD